MGAFWHFRFGLRERFVLAFGHALWQLGLGRKKGGPLLGGHLVKASQTGENSPMG
jgi:hypothetical protein